MSGEDTIIYLDNAATTPLDPRVLEAMMPYFTDLYANPASNHSFGVQVNQAVKAARKQIADLIKCEPSEVIFTSGATEAINLAIKGIAEAYQAKGKHIVTVATEHKAVLDTCAWLESKGWEVTYLGVQPDGLLRLEDVKAAIRKDTILLSVMFANNEIGVIQPIERLGIIAHEAGCLFMTDATQAFGKVPVDVDQMGIDLLAFSGHKIYGPKGIGGLYVRSKGKSRVRLNPIIHGGGHERNLRSGTLNVPGIVGLGRAAEIADEEKEDDSKRIRKLRDYLEEELLKLKGAFINGDKEHRLPNISNICFPGIDADAMILTAENVMLSTGSACTSNKIKPSHVLLALSDSSNHQFSIRFSLGKSSTLKEIKIAISKLVDAHRQLCNYSY